MSVLVVLPLLLLFVFSTSERSMRAWLHLGLDSEVEVLEAINTGKFTQAQVGKYLSSLKSSFPGEVVGDMVCFLRVYLELAIRAKGILLLREAGVNIPEDMEIKEKLTELKYLEKSIGKAGRLAIQPLLRMNDRDLWQLHMLGRDKIR